MRYLSLLMLLSFSIHATAAEELPETLTKSLLWRESCENEKTENVSRGLKLNSPRFDKGVSGNGWLIEQPNADLLSSRDFDDKAGWILIGTPEFRQEGGAFSPSCATVDGENYLRQVVEKLQEGKSYCFSTYARAETPGSRLRILLDKTELVAVAPGKEFGRFTATFTAAYPVSTITLQGVGGTVVVDAAQIDYSCTFPTSFVPKGRRSNQINELKGEGNLNPKRGALSLWFKPHWMGETGMGYGLAGFGNDGTYFFLRAYPDKDEPAHVWKNRLLWGFRGKAGEETYSGASCVSPPLQEWQNREWHHVAVNWDFLPDEKLVRTEMYLDGKLASDRKFIFPGVMVPETFLLGYWHGGYANAVMDEIMVFDRPVTAEEAEALFRLRAE